MSYIRSSLDVMINKFCPLIGGAIVKIRKNDIGGTIINNWNGDLKVQIYNE